jgi:hypothetical protein
MEVEWFNKHEAEEPANCLGPTWSKAEGHCLRLALVLHLSRLACRETKSTQIDEHSMRGAVLLIEYFKSHAGRVYGLAADSEDNGRIAKAFAWVRKQAKAGKKITARLVQMNGVCGVRDAEAAKELLHDLAELGHGTVVEESQGSVVFRPHPHNTQQLNTSTKQEAKS